MEKPSQPETQEASKVARKDAVIAASGWFGVWTILGILHSAVPAHFDLQGVGIFGVGTLALVPWLFKSLKASKDGVEIESQNVYAQETLEKAADVMTTEATPQVRTFVPAMSTLTGADPQQPFHTEHFVIREDQRPALTEYQQRLVETVQAPKASLVSSSLRAQLIELRIEIEHELRRAVNMVGLQPKSASASAKQMLRSLTVVLPADMIQSLSKVLDLANRAAHIPDFLTSGSIDPETASEIVSGLKKYWLKPEFLSDILQFRAEAHGESDSVYFIPVRKGRIPFARAKGVDIDATLLPVEPSPTVRALPYFEHSTIAWIGFDGNIYGDGPYWLTSRNISL